MNSAPAPFRMLTCVLFVFLELAEFTLVLHLARTQKERWMGPMERTAKVMLPALFLCFNVVYWYIVIAERQNFPEFGAGKVIGGN